MEDQEEGTKHKSAFVKKVWVTAGIIALIYIVLMLFKSLFGVFLLVLAGALMAIYFHGCAALLQKMHIPKKIALFIAVLLNFALIGCFFWFVGSRLKQQIAQMSDTLPGSIKGAKQWVTQLPGGDNALNYLNSSGDSGKALSFVQSFFSSTFGILSDTYIIFLLGLFFTASPLLYKNGIIKLLPSPAKKEGEKILDQIHETFRNWLIGMLFGVVFIAILSGLGLWAVGMPLVLTLALLAGILNFIPNFGPIIALIPACLIALTLDPTTVLLVFGIYTLIQIVQSAVTKPLIQKKMINMPPALVIFGQIALGSLGGFWGILLATPIVAILIILVDKLYIKQQSEQR